MGEPEVLWGGTPILLPVPITLQCPACQRQCHWGEWGCWIPSRPWGLALGNAAVGRARREQAPAKVNSATDVPRLRVLTDAPVPGAWASGCHPHPQILLFLTRVLLHVFFLWYCFGSSQEPAASPFLRG